MMKLQSEQQQKKESKLPPRPVHNVIMCVCVCVFFVRVRNIA